jgi:hypothetical protein
VDPWAHEDERQAGKDGDPQAHGDEGLHRVVVVATEGEAWLEAGRSAAVEDDGSIAAVLAMVVDHGHVDVGVAPGEARDGAGDQRGDGGGEAGQPQPATPQAGDLAEFLLGLVQACEHRLGVRQEGAAGVGEACRSHTPDSVREGMARLAEELGQVGRTPESFPVAIATAWLYVTNDNGAAERALSNVLAPMLQRPVEALRSAPLLIGPAKLCVERLAAFVDAGVRRIFVWPLGDERRQLELFRERVTCLLPGQPCTATRQCESGNARRCRSVDTPAVPTRGSADPRFG